MADLFKYEEENLFKFEDGGDLFKYEDQPSQFKLDANQPVSGELKNFVPQTQPLVRESNVLNTKPIEPTIKNSPSTIYRSDNPLLNSVLGIPRALESGALQTAQAVTGAMYDVDPNAARERMRVLDERQQALRLAAGGQADYEQGAGSMAALAPLVAAGPGVMSLGAGLLAGGPAYQQAREKDIGPLGSAAYAAGQGGLEYATERIPLGIMFGQGGKGVIERLVKAVMPEITSEQIATLTQDALEQAVLNPEKSWDEYWNERGQAAVQTLKATVGGMGAAGAIMQAQQMLTPEQTKGEQFAQALQNEVNTTDLGAQNASQVQGPSAGMLRQERPQMGLQENGGAYAQPQEATGKGQAQEVMFSKWYSPLAKAFEGAKQETMPGNQWRAWINSNASKMGVKTDEIQWSGLPEYLELRGKDKVTKAEIADYLSGNGVRVEDVVKKSSSKYNYQGNEWQIAIDQAEARGDFDEAERINRAWEGLDEETGSTAGQPKFSDWWSQSYKDSIDGTYREILVTLQKDGTQRLKELRNKAIALQEKAIDAGRDMTPDELAEWNKLKREMATASVHTPAGGFTSSHWDEPNVLVHLRLDEVTVADGKRYVRVGEIQSDWGQKGKKEGFEENKPLSDEEADRWAYLDSLGSDMTEEQRIEYSSLDSRNEAWLSRETESGARGVPSAPFITDTKAWVALGIKRAIQYASDIGADGIIFGTGQQNADLYDLSKQVESISYMKDGDKYRVFANQLGGQGQIDIGIKTANELGDIVGKDVSQKIINGEGVKSGDLTTLRGLDLRVGGEGMRQFYDRIVPQVASDVLKKIGGKVEKIDDAYGFTIPAEMKTKVQGEGLPLFARGTGKGMTVNEVITAITKKFGKKAGKLINEGRLRIVQSASDLPEWGRNQKGIGGAWDGKTAWIVADSMNPNKVIGAYLHEVGEHAGMRGIMGDNYQQLINRFNELLQEGDAIAVKADSRVPKDTRAGDVAQERIAYFIEEATKAQQANTLSEKAIRLLKDIIAAMRAWAYRKFGGVKLNADDFVALAKHAANVWADAPTQEKVDSPMFTKEDVDELAKKFAFAIKGQADARIQSSAEKAFLDNQDMFERMKRGVVSVKDSEAAGDLLAKEVGWSPESIDQFIKDAGTQGVPPVEILAATMAMSRMQSLKLLEAQDPAEFLDYTADVLNTLMATRAYGSEMGRALQFIGAMERKGGYTPEQAKAQVPTAKKQAKQTADKAFEILKDKSVSHEDMKKALGGDKGIKKIMEAIKAQGKDIDLGMLVQYLSGVADGIVQAQKEDTTKVNSLMNMAMELFQANILTGIFTHEVNITSNMANMFVEFAFIQPVKGLVGGKKGLAGTAAGYKMMGGYKQLLSDIWALMKYNAFEELPASRLSHLLAQRDPTMISLMRGSEGSKWNDTKRKYIPGKAGKIIRGYGFVPLGVEDAIFKVIPFRFELARQQGAGETQDIAKAIRFAEEMTFQSKSEFASTVARFTSKHPSTKPWLLFIKTMTNIMKRITELTPVAGQVYNKKELLGLEGKDAQQSAVARMIVGWSLAAMLWGLIDDGEDDGEIGIIGYGPSERRKEALWKKAGNEQVALRVGEDLYPFYRLDPVAGFIGLVAAEKKAATYAEGEKYDDAMVEIANGFYQAIMSKHFMVNVEETIGLMQDLIRYQKPQEEIEDEGKYKAPTPLDRVRRSMAKMGMSMVIPNIIPQIGDMTDEQKRKTRTIEDDLLRKFPILREQLPEMLDVSGQPMEEPRYHSPYPINKKHAPRDEVSRWMMKLGRTLESDPVRLRGLDKDVRKELLQRRWDRVTLAYDISKDMPKDIQKDNLEKALGAWSRESGRIIMMEELNKE